MVERWTEADLRRIAPGGRDDYIGALVDGWNAVMSIGIRSNVGLCHFLAQTLHETGGFTIVRENCNWTLGNCKANWPLHFNASAAGLATQARFAACRSDVDKANLIYGKLVDGLGNNHPSDGFDYRGGSFSQLTGRAAFREYGQRLGVDLEGQPHMIEQPAIGLMVYCEIWRRFGLAQLADHNYGRAIGNAINRGNPFSKHQPIGAAGREEWFRICWRVLGRGEDLPDPLTLYIGASGPEVKAVQTRLRELGYAVGNVDGIFGREMARAVVAFKHDRGLDDKVILEAAECVGRETRAALAEAKPIDRSERAKMTVADLAAAGSKHVSEAQGMMMVGKVLTGLGAAGGAVSLADGAPQPVTAQTPASVEMMQQALAWAPSFHQFMVPVIDAFRFFVANWLPIVVLLAGVWFVVKGRRIIAARLEDARKGLHLGR